jgi:hypothetical protein
MITLENIGKFKMSYDLARQQKKETFMFEGSEVLVGYAKYVIQHFDGLLKK